ncbi:MAG: GldG family protein [Gammaproteobacteria bacterium]
MRVDSKSRWQLRAQNTLFVLLFVGVLCAAGWLSQRYSFQSDWTANNRNTLSETSRQVLESLAEPVLITAYVADDAALHQRVKQRVARYQRYQPDMTLDFINPDLQPGIAESAGITRTGQLAVTVGERSEIVDDMAEQTLTNALQRLSRAETRFVVFLEGHDERSPFEDSNQGLSQLANVLEGGGFAVQGLNLTRNPAIPDNTSVLVLAAPQSQLLEGEVNAIRDYVAGGGNLLWLRDPGESFGLEPLAEEFGISFIDGVVVDANPEYRVLLGIDHPAIVPVVDYGLHDVSQDLKAQTLFPFAIAIDIDKGMGWRSHPLLNTLPRAWAETGGLGGEQVTFDEDRGDRMGPLVIGAAFAREYEGESQRAVIVGDSDFAANVYVGNGANLQLALNMFNWLSRDDSLISISVKSAPDTRLEVTRTSTILMGAGLLLVLPLALLGAGFASWFRRKRR